MGNGSQARMVGEKLAQEDCKEKAKQSTKQRGGMARVDGRTI